MSALEKNTNQLYRQKYFVDERTVIRFRPPSAGVGRSMVSTVIPAQAVRLSPVSVPMNAVPPPADAQMSVKLIRDGDVLKGIRIQCPCGRHAELDVNVPMGKGAGK